MTRTDRSTPSAGIRLARILYAAIPLAMVAVLILGSFL